LVSNFQICEIFLVLNFEQGKRTISVFILKNGT
jgi:hypothetical protein